MTKNTKKMSIVYICQYFIKVHLPAEITFWEEVGTVKLDFLI